MDLYCCGYRMIWAGYERNTDIYLCGWCQRVRLVECPRVSPRYLGMGGHTPCM